MATLDFQASDQPRGLRAVLSLADNSLYTIENLSNSVRVRLREVLTVGGTPSRAEEGHTLKPGSSALVRIRPGEEMWCWVPKIAGEAPCVLTPPA